MKTQVILVILSLFLLIAGSSFSQQYGSTSYTNVISGKTVINIKTGLVVPEKELKELLDTNPNFSLEPVIDKYGRIASYEYDPANTDKSRKRDVTKRVKPGEPFPPFVFNSMRKRKLVSDDLLGKYILIQFQLMFRAPFFMEDQLVEFESTVAELQITTDLEAIIVTESPKAEIKRVVDPDTLRAEIIPDGRNFSQRYLVTKFPSHVLVDKEGNLLAYYAGTKLEDIKAYIISLEQ